MLKIRYVLFLPLVITILLFSQGVHLSQAQTPTPTSDPTPTPDNSGTISDLQNKIKDYQSKINDLQGQEKTFSSQIGIMNNQISLTELKIQAAQEQLVEMEKDIEVTKQRTKDLEKNIAASTKALIGRIGATYQVGRIDPWQVLLTSDNITNFLTRLTYLKLVQANDKKNIYAAQQNKANYESEKTVLEDKQKAEEIVKGQLIGYTTQLNQDKAAKQTLLDQTKGSESNYQRLLAQTQAQLASFSNFVQSQGGASLLSGQTSCNDWGCYYNQRDSQWGGTSLNGTQYTIASDGCLVTSMAMVYTHYGHRDVTPISINSNSGNFSGIPAALLKREIYANGVYSQRISADIDSALASGPVIIGISYDGGTWPDHFVVFISGSNGNYMMNDPFTPNGQNISFRDRYPGVRIVETDRVSF